MSLREMGLPAHMIPSRIVFVDALPHTPSGKLDRHALVDAHGVSGAIGVEHVAPRDEVEAKLAAVWTRVLSVPDVGIHDNFFDLGGHSLTAARAAAQASRGLRIDISVRDVFTYPTVAELAAYLNAIEWVAASSPSGEGENRTHEDVTL
jgi:acyl carrier protein